MASYAPKINDFVLLDGHTGRFVVVGLDVPRMTADVRSTGDEGFLVRNVPWEAISDLEEVQTPPEPCRDATENK